MAINTIFGSISIAPYYGRLNTKMDKSFTFFQNLIKEQFEGSFASSYDKIEEWTSMQSLIVVSTIDEHFDVLISHIDLKSINSLEDLHQKVILMLKN